MKISIFGASRGVGRAALELASARGHLVTAVARNLDRAPGAAGVTVIAGDVLERDVVARALDGADAVIVSLGTAPSRGDAGAQRAICSRGTELILDVMRSRGQRRLVVVSSYGVGPTTARRPFPFNVVAATLLKDVMADKERQEQIIRASDTDWTIVQPLGLTDEAPTNAPFVSTSGERTTSRVPRADVAAVCLDAIEQHTYVRESIAVSAPRLPAARTPQRA